MGKYCFNTYNNLAKNKINNKSLHVTADELNEENQSKHVKSLDSEYLKTILANQKNGNERKLNCYYKRVKNIYSEMQKLRKRK